MSKEPETLLFKDECYAIIGACFEVYNEMGSGFAEAVYQECLEIELKKRKVPCVAWPQVQIQYKGEVLKKRYEPDLVCYGKVIVELKALTSLLSEHRSQLLNYLKATDMRLGLLVNFGKSGDLEWQRIVK